MSPEDLAKERGHRLGQPNTTGRFAVRTCRRCGLRLVVSEDNPNGFGGALEQSCRNFDPESAA
jgi:hypothetical protein